MNVHAMSERVYERLNYINFQKKFLAQKFSGQKVPPDYFALEINQ